MNLRFFSPLVALSLSFNLMADSASLINGAGATFPYPLYSKWFSEYQKVSPDTQINYQSIGSGGGIRQFTDRTVDFGATDVPMTDEQLKKIPETVYHIPTALGSVVIAYHLPGVKGLKLTSDLIADIFLGTITHWNDARLTKINPGLALSGEIIVAHRSDGSGTTGVFTDYLSKVSPAWKEKVGQGTAVNWPVGLGGKGNEGVAGLVKQTKGSIGYVEFVYAEQNSLSYAAVQNKAKNFVVPSTRSITAAAAGALNAMPADFRVSITDAAGKDTYPISSFTYLLVHKSQKDGTKGKRFVKFLKWSLRDGQKHAENLKYAPLPTSLVSKVEKVVDQIETSKIN